MRNFSDFHSVNRIDRKFQNKKKLNTTWSWTC